MGRLVGDASLRVYIRICSLETLLGAQDSGGVPNKVACECHFVKHFVHTRYPKNTLISFLLKNKIALPLTSVDSLVPIRFAYFPWDSCSQCLTENQAK